MPQKIDITASEMREMRAQGLSNHDIARSLDISVATVRRYIGRQDGRMEPLAAFKDSPPRKNMEKEAEAEPMTPKYEPKPCSETFDIGNMRITLSHDEKMARISCGMEIIFINYVQIPDLVQFLVWAMRERMEVTADAQGDEIREPGSEPERGEV